ncbi:hypothetical protein Q4433_05570 [Streptococcus parasanguinis]|uniref:hypothetical protein n=1 Tax=Streptococcus parasanguinis TaxID=1318 RepID=UPI0012BCAA97|nr:hypothetical protein [Streptococcus parasanguinis]MDO6230310.1 hypothetical protein [Streptococcus parasanguinis]MTS08918.1 hypothetical protein [Streptococcus parasanguinis]
MHQILKLEEFHQSHTRIPSGNEASAFEDFWKPGGQTFPGNMPEAIPIRTISIIKVWGKNT